jgi:predicted N-acyltransferase
MTPSATDLLATGSVAENCTLAADAIRAHVVASTDSIPWDDWQKLCPNADAMMDRRFLAATERSMSDTHRFWYVTLYDANDDAEHEPLAVACVSYFVLDAVLLASPWIRRAVGWVRWIVPRYLKFRVILCGMPVSAGGSNLRLAPDVESGPVMEALNRELVRIAKQQRAWLVVAKEFDPDECRYVDHLARLGYLRTDSPPMNEFRHRYADFDAFLAEVRSHYRYKINRSRKKFAKAGLRVERYTDPAAIAPLYTPEVHRLYEDVVARAEHKLEVLPREFFMQMSAQFGPQVSLTVVRQGDRIVGFAWGLHTEGVYRNLFVGVDYTINDETDVYFNLMMQDLDFALRSGAAEILVGQTADVFKSRLGCESTPRVVYIKCVARWLHELMKLTAPILFPPLPLPPARDLFKPATEEAAAGGTGESA